MIVAKDLTSVINSSVLVDIHCKNRILIGPVDLFSISVRVKIEICSISLAVDIESVIIGINDKRIHINSGVLGALVFIRDRLSAAYSPSELPVINKIIPAKLPHGKKSCSSIICINYTIKIILFELHVVYA